MKDENYYQNIDERIERFMKGEMTLDEERYLKRELRSDEELRSHAMAMAALVKGVKTKLKEQDKQVIAENVQEEGSPNHKITSIRKYIWIGGIAAMLVVAAGLFFIGQDNPSKSTYDAAPDNHRHICYEPSENVRGEEDCTVVAELDRLFTEVAEGRTTNNAMVRLEELYSELDNDITYRMYENDIAWYLALAYIKNDKIDKAKIVLEKIIADNPETPISEKAKKLLNEIK